MADALEKSTGTKIRVILIAGIACARDVSLRAVETEAPLQRRILREHLLSPTASTGALADLFMVQVSLSGRLFAPRELAIIGHILPSGPSLEDGDGRQSLGKHWKHPP